MGRSRHHEPGVTRMEVLAITVFLGFALIVAVLSTVAMMDHF